MGLKKPRVQNQSLAIQPTSWIIHCIAACNRKEHPSILNSFCSFTVNSYARLLLIRLSKRAYINSPANQLKIVGASRGIWFPSIDSTPASANDKNVRELKEVANYQHRLPWVMLAMENLERLRKVVVLKG